MSYINHKWFAIFNPFANHGVAASHEARIRQLLDENDFEYDWHTTTHQGHGIALATYALKEGYRKIMTVGGGGNFTDMLNGLMKQEACHPHDVELVQIPIGAHNDWTNCHGIPKDYEEWIPMIQSTPLQNVDVGKAEVERSGAKNTRYFVSMVGVALVGLVVKKMYEFHEDSSSKSEMRQAIWDIAMKFPRFNLALNYDGHQEQGQYVYLNVSTLTQMANFNMTNIKRSPGKFILTRDKGKYNRFSFLKDITFNLFVANKLYESKHAYATEVGAIEIKSLDKDTNFKNYIHVDGDYAGEGNCKISMIPNGIKIRYPRQK